LYVRYWQHRRVPSSPTRYWVWQTRYSPRPWRFDGVILASSSTHHRLHFSTAPPRHHYLAPPCGPAASCAATSTATSTTATLRTASSTMDIHPLLGYLDLGTKGYHPPEASSVFLRPQHLYCKDVMSAGGCQSVGSYLWLLLQSHRLQCSRYDCGGIRVYWDISIIGRLGLYPDFTIP
jgi:hypothetical protein